MQTVFCIWGKNVQGIARSTFLLLSFFLSGILLAQEYNFTCEQCVDYYRTSLDQIKSIEADGIDYMKGRCDESSLDFDKEPNGIASVYHWFYDFDTDKEYIKTLDPHFAGDGITIDGCEDQTAGYNGDIFYSFSYKLNSGRRQRDKRDQYGGSYMRRGLFPVTLLGLSVFTSHHRTIIDVLEEDKEKLELIPSDDGNVVLHCFFQDYGETGELFVTLDPQHGFLLRHVEQYRAPFNVLEWKLDVTNFIEAKPGIWFPVEGQTENFYMEKPILEDGVHYANGMTFEEIDALPEEEQWKIIPTLGFRSIPLNEGPTVLMVNPETLKINEPFDESLLTLEKFPDGMYVWDDILRLGYKVGRFDDPNYIESKKTTTGELIFRIVFITIGLVVIFSALGYLLKKRFTNKTNV